MSEPFAVLQSLHVYPVKSCAGVALNDSLLIESGLEFDRAWMVVDAEGRGMTRHQADRLPLVTPKLGHRDMVLRAPGMLALHVSLDTVEGPCDVEVWGRRQAAFDMGPLAAQWFSDYLGRPARLVRFDPAPDADAPTFSNGSQLMVSSAPAMAVLEQRLAQAPAQFRPNLVLDTLPAGTERLEIDTPDGPVALRLTGPSRCFHRVAEAAGMNAVIEDGVERLLKVGAQVRLR